MFEGLRYASEKEISVPMKFRVYQKKDNKWNSCRQLILKGACLGMVFIDDLIKIKIKAEKGAEDTYQLKLTTPKQDIIYSLKQKDQITCFLELIRVKLLKLTRIWPEQSNDKSTCEGTVLRKDFFGKWESNYFYISKCGLIVSKNKHADHSEMLIDSIKELWTRFELVENYSCIVFKVKHVLRKHEFAIPLQDALKWAQAFSSLIDYQ